MLDEKYMRRCFELANRADKEVKLNPLVGAVIVYQDRILGEGYHKRSGGHHAEVEAIQGVTAADRKFLSSSTLYVSLEPCNHQGKTPPCTSAIISNQIPEVVISCLDPNPLMSGKSVKLLEEKGLKVTTGVLRKEGHDLIKIYRTTALKKPYIILKYAQSTDGYLGKKGEQVWLSNAYSKVLVHKWRSKVDGILIGVNTANIDDPQLTTRLYSGQSPIRIIIDPNGKLLANLQLLNDGLSTLVFTTIEKYADDHRYITMTKEEFTIESILDRLYKLGIYRLMVEGGKFTLSSIIKTQLWDEARVITAPRVLDSGIKAPTIVGLCTSEFNLGSDKVQVIMNPKS